MFGLEPICRVLTAHGLKIATSTCYAAKNRRPSARAPRDEQLKEYVSRVHAVTYGVRKVWRRLHREGIEVVRCTVARLVPELGPHGARRGKTIRTAVRDDGHERAAGLLRRDFTATRPDQRWVADFTYVMTGAGVVYVAFVVDVYSRAVVGWSAATTQRAKLKRNLAPTDRNPSVKSTAVRWHTLQWGEKMAMTRRRQRHWAVSSMVAALLTMDLVTRVVRWHAKR